MSSLSVPSSSVSRLVNFIRSRLHYARRATLHRQRKVASYVALLLAGVERKDRALMPTLTFVAAANAISFCEIALYFGNCAEHTLGLDPIALRKYLNSIAELRDGQCVNITTGSIIRAMVPMHTFEHPVEIDGLLSIAKDFNLVIVEDAPSP